MAESLEIGVLGAGMMGTEIALCFAIAGYKVGIKDKTIQISEMAKDRMGRVLDKGMAKGTFQIEDKKAVFSNIIPVDSYDAFEQSEMVLEAVYEDFSIKSEVLAQIDNVCKPECIILSNTSGISITHLATALKPGRSAQFAGAHFFSPASIMKLVEVIPGLETEEETLSATFDYCRKIGKTPIKVKDVPGFVVNRIFHAMLIETCRLVEEEVASIEDIDTACKLGLGHPIGPFKLMDLLDNSLNLRVQEILFESYGERFRPRPNLRQRVYGNHLGRKTGKGWYNYSE